MLDYRLWLRIQNRRMAPLCSVRRRPRTCVVTVESVEVNVTIIGCGSNGYAGIGLTASRRYPAECDRLHVKDSVLACLRNVFGRFQYGMYHSRGTLAQRVFCGYAGTGLTASRRYPMQSAIHVLGRFQDGMYYSRGHPSARGAQVACPRAPSQRVIRLARIAICLLP